MGGMMGRGVRGWRGVGAAFAALVLAACNSAPVPTPSRVPATSARPIRSPAPSPTRSPSPTASATPVAAAWQRWNAPNLQATTVADPADFEFNAGSSASINDAVRFGDGVISVGGDALGARVWQMSSSLEV